MLYMPSNRSMLRDREDLPPLTLHIWQWRTDPVLSPCVRTSEAADTAQSQEHHRLAAFWSLCTEPVVTAYRQVETGHDEQFVTHAGHIFPQAHPSGRCVHCNCNCDCDCNCLRRLCVSHLHVMPEIQQNCEP